MIPNQKLVLTWFPILHCTACGTVSNHKYQCDFQNTKVKFSNFLKYFQIFSNIFKDFQIFSNIFFKTMFFQFHHRIIHLDTGFRHFATAPVLVSQLTFQRNFLLLPNQENNRALVSKTCSLLVYTDKLQMWQTFDVFHTFANISGKKLAFLSN